jgi:hypothetical protein
MGEELDFYGIMLKELELGPRGKKHQGNSFYY